MAQLILSSCSKPAGLGPLFRIELFMADRMHPRRISRVGIVYYEYMALAKKTSVLREAMLFSFEPQRFVCPAEYADIF